MISAFNFGTEYVDTMANILETPIRRRPALRQIEFLIRFFGIYSLDGFKRVL